MPPPGFPLRRRPGPRPPALSFVQVRSFARTWTLAPVIGLLLLSLLFFGGCERSGERSSTKAAPPQQANEQVQAGEVTHPSPADSAPVILFLGDSLTAGFGLVPEKAYPALLQNQLRSAGYPHRVVNAGVSGDTTAGGRARLDWVLRQGVFILVLALGANDGLRGLKIEAIRDNLAAIIERAQGRGIQVLLAGMQMPANYGPQYTAHFKAIYPELANQYHLKLIPFLLAGVAMRDDLNQPDRIHPNTAGAKIVAENVWNVLQTTLKR